MNERGLTHGNASLSGLRALINARHKLVKTQQ
jgi:hypothetical protein